MTIRALDDFVFEGFLIQGRRVDPNSDESEPIGRFEVTEGTRELCIDRYGVSRKSYKVLFYHAYCLFHVYVIVKHVKVRRKIV